MADAKHDIEVIKPQTIDDFVKYADNNVARDESNKHYLAHLDVIKEVENWVKKVESDKKLGKMKFEDIKPEQATMLAATYLHEYAMKHLADKKGIKPALKGFWAHFNDYKTDAARREFLTRFAREHFGRQRNGASILEAMIDSIEGAKNLNDLKVAFAESGRTHYLEERSLYRRDLQNKYTDMIKGKADWALKDSLKLHPVLTKYHQVDEKNKDKFMEQVTPENGYGFLTTLAGAYNRDQKLQKELLKRVGLQYKSTDKK